MPFSLASCFPGCQCGDVLKDTSKLIDLLLTIKQHLLRNQQAAAESSWETITAALRGNCRYHQAKFIIALYCVGVNMVHASHQVDRIMFDIRQNESQGASISQVTFNEIMRQTLGKPDDGHQRSWLKKLVMLLHLVLCPLGSMTGSALSNFDNMVGLNSEVMSKTLGYLGWSVLCLLFVSQPPSLTVPTYTRSRKLDGVVYSVCLVLAFVFSLSSTELTQNSARNAAVELFGASNATAKYVGNVAAGSNLLLNSAMGTGVFLLIGVLVKTIYRLSTRSKFHAVVNMFLSLVALMVGFATCLEYVYAGFDAWGINKIEDTAAKWIVSIISNLANVLVILIPCCFGSSSAIFNDKTIHWLNKCLSVLMGILGGALFTTLLEESLKSELDLPAGAHYSLLVACSIISGKGMMAHSAEALRALTESIGKTGGSIVAAVSRQWQNTSFRSWFTCCTAVGTASEHQRLLTEEVSNPTYSGPEEASASTLPNVTSAPTSTPQSFWTRLRACFPPEALVSAFDNWGYD